MVTYCIISNKLPSSGVALEGKYPTRLWPQFLYGRFKQRSCFVRLTEEDEGEMGAQSLPGRERKQLQGRRNPLSNLGTVTLCASQFSHLWERGIGLSVLWGPVNSKCYNSRCHRGFWCLWRVGQLLLRSLQQVGLIHDTDRKEGSRLVTGKVWRQFSPSSTPRFRPLCEPLLPLGGWVGGSW